MTEKTDILLDGTCLSKVALGTHRFCMATAKESAKVLDCYLENGGNVIDTARCYGEDVTHPNDPQSERCIGQWLRESGMRKQIILITKGGNPEYKDGKQVRNRITEADIEADINKSLTDLGTDYIDIYFFHKDDITVDPGEAIEILNKYVKAGIVRHIGASNWSAERIIAANQYARAHGLREFEYSELAFSLKDHVTEGWGENEKALEMSRKDFQFYQKSQIPVFGYGAQAYGFFYWDTPGEAASEKNRKLFEELRNICKERGINTHQALYGFYFGCGIPNIPLVSAKNVSRLKEVMDNCDVTLEKEDVEKLLEIRFGK